ncbi:class I SAM-dependent DNA methyltransferase [Methylobacterium gregans]
MHYTSPSNIAKVLNPILLDELRAELEKAGSNRGRLHELLKRLGRIRVFDPACGSGNFLILAYKDLRAIEMEIFIRLGEFAHPVVKLEHFYGIEIDDFACETARLGLWIAEYQVNENFRQKMGKAPPALPLTAAGRVICANSATADWLDVCPIDPEKETYVVGNPPFKGARNLTKEQRSDIDRVMGGKIKGHKDLDYVSIWFYKSTIYSMSTGCKYALVATNSLVQGASVASLWPFILKDLEIKFAHRSFKWTNLASNNAGVACVVIGIGAPSQKIKKLYDEGSVRDVDTIGPYLAPNVSTVVEKRSSPIAKYFPAMTFGNQPNNGDALLLDRSEREAIVSDFPQASNFIKRLYGSGEMLKGSERWCIWVTADNEEQARKIEPFNSRFNIVRDLRMNSTRAQSVKLARTPWAFDPQNRARNHMIVIPRHSSESRNWLPVDVFDNSSIAHDSTFAIYDGDIWAASVLSSRMHRLWLDTVGGKLEDRLRYSNQLVWNTFPLPTLSDRRKDELEEHWWEIDRARKEAGFGRTLGDLYVPKTMPPDLRRAHEELDETVEAIFGSRKYRSDADRIEHMLQLYERAIADELGRRA